MIGNIILMIKTLTILFLFCSFELFAKSYEVSFPKDWSVKENSFGSDYFAYTPIRINKESATIFIKEYKAKIQDPLVFITKDIEKNFTKNIKKYKNLNIFKSTSKKIGSEEFHIVDYYYFDNTKNKIVYSKVAILNLKSTYLYINYAGEEAVFNDYKKDVNAIMKSIRMK